MEETIVRKLHVSGLTPAITVADLLQRLSSFGKVTAVDGFGLVDAMGQPRKFGYVTLETTKAKLAKCMNLLSGVTWKGAKLRLGEAKPDFRERIANENETLKRAASDPSAEPPRKRHRLPRGVQGIHAQDMSLVTPENAASRPGWRVTPLGRLIRPVRLRPEHPLPDPLRKVLHKVKGKKPQKEKPQKKRVKKPLTRARRRTIDPTKWGSQHLKGVFLETGAILNAERSVRMQHDSVEVEEESEDDKMNGEEEWAEGEDEAMEVDERSPSPPRKASPPPLQPPMSVAPKAMTIVDDRSDLAQETQKSLGLLQALFGDRGDEEWGGAESVGSDIEFDDNALSMQTQEEEIEDDYIAVNDDVPAIEAEARVQPQEKPPIPAPMQTTKLKDLFAPREEDAGFSLLGHLDLDLELDDEIDLQLTAEPQPRPAPQTTTTVPPHTSALSAFDPKRPMFFPLPPEEHERTRGRTRDVLDTTDWHTWFFRSDSVDDIQTRWEETRGELTSGWKRRHREAVKSRRRRGGGADEGDA